MEALFKGAKGDKGSKGEKGDLGITVGARRAIIYLFILTLLLTAGDLAYTTHLVDQVRAQQQAECKFDGDIGTAPVVAQKGLKPSLLGVTIISDARVAWRQHGCPGHLTAADPSFVRWARAFHLPYQ